jgi:NADH-quinone oxidoreductase subunit N
MSSELDRVFFLFGVTMIVVAFGIMIFAFPFGMWFVDFFDGAPAPASVYAATSLLISFQIAFMRFSASAVSMPKTNWQTLISVFSIATILAGLLGAMRQENIRRMLGYSVLCHSGLLLAAFALPVAATSQLKFAIITYLVAYAVAMAGTMALLMLLSPDSDGDIEINRLAGLSGRNPVLAATFSIFMMSMAGLPLTIGFWARFVLIKTILLEGSGVLAAVVGAASLGMFYFMMRPVAIIYFRRIGELKIDEGAYNDCGLTSLPLVAVTAIAAVVTVFFGILPENFMALVMASS